MNRAHLVPFALAFVAGIVAGNHSVGIPILCSCVAAALVLRQVPRGTRSLIVAALALGVLEAQIALHGGSAIADGRTTRFAATVVDERSLDGERDAVTLRLADESLASTALPLPVPAIGARLMLRGKRVAFDGPRNPGEPSPRELAAERGLTWRIARPDVLHSEAPDARDASLWLARARAWASQRVHAQLGEPEATILAGALWGERSTLPPDLRAEFQDTGTVHVLVTAGLHLGIVAGLAYGLLARVELASPKIPRNK